MRVVIADLIRNPFLPPFLQKSIGLCPYFFGNLFRQKVILFAEPTSVGVYFWANKKAPFIKGEWQAKPDGGLRFSGRRGRRPPQKMSSQFTKK
jgi:hypothetical protein